MADSSHPTHTRATWMYAGLVFAAAIITDQASKMWARAALDGSASRPLIGQWLSLSLVHNSGAAFSFAAGTTWILTIFTVVIIGALVVMARRVHRASTLLAIALLAEALSPTHEGVRILSSSELRERAARQAE